MEINHCPVRAVLEGEIGVFTTVPCCRVFNWDDGYIKTVAVHQGFKNFTVFFPIHCTWEHKPSVCVKLQLSSKITAVKKSQVDLQGLWGWFVSSFKFSIIAEHDGVGGCSWWNRSSSDPQPGVSLVCPSCPRPAEHPLAVPLPGHLQKVHFPAPFLFLTLGKSLANRANPSPVHFTGLVSLMVPLT